MLKWKSIKKNDCFPVKSEPVGMWSIIGAFGFLGLGLMTSLGLLVIECLSRVLKRKFYHPVSTTEPKEKKLSLLSWKY